MDSYELLTLRNEMSDDFIADAALNDDANFSVCLDALGQSDDGIEAFRLFLELFNDGENISDLELAFNNKLARALFLSVRKYIDESISDEEVFDHANKM